MYLLFIENPIETTSEPIEQEEPAEPSEEELRPKSKKKKKVGNFYIIYGNAY